MKKIYSILFMLVALVATVNAASYKGTLDITMMGSEIAKGQAAVVDMNEAGEGNYTFVLPDFSVTIGDAVLPLGDIVVENVTRTDENGDGTFEIAGMVEDLALPNDPSIADEEKIHAKVEIAGTETAEGAMDLDIVVGWYTAYPDDLTQTMPIEVKFVGQLVPVSVYEGKLDISMMGSEIAKGQDASVQLKDMGEGNYTFVLPNFSVTIGDAVLPLGDIVVENVTRTDDNGDGIFEIGGMVEDLALPDDPSIADEEKIHAKVEIAGTETADGAMDLDIVVGWYTAYPDDLTQTIPIDVKFVGQKKEDSGSVNNAFVANANVYGVNGAVVVNGFDGVVEVYDFTGRLVKSAQVVGNAEVALAKGLYIVRTGAKAAKVVVK